MLNLNKKISTQSVSGVFKAIRIPIFGQFTIAWISLFVLSACSVVNAQSFEGLGDLPGGSVYSRAVGVSGNGDVVVGRSGSANGGEGFVWTSAGGMVGLGDLPGGISRSRARNVSADGSTIVGEGDSVGGREAVQWSFDGVISSLGGTAGGSNLARDASTDGSVIVGSDEFGTEYFNAFRWTSSNGLVNLGTLPGRDYSSAWSVSADGSTIVGSSGRTPWEAFIWTSAGGMVGLGHLPSGTIDSRGNGVSGDGLVVVGTSTSGASSSREAYRWTSQTGMVGLGGLALGDTSSAQSVSFKGDFIVGTNTSSTGSVRTPYIWDEINGMRSVQVVLTDAGVDLTGWDLTRVYGISDDGTTIVGWGLNPDGNEEAWRATITSAPQTVTPASVTPTRGDYISGGVPEVEASDNMDYSMRRRQTDTQSRTEFEVKAISPIASPSSMEVTLEGSVFARTQVDQTIELFDYVAGVWEEVDTRVATRFTDSVVTIAATGDLSRFVEVGTMFIKARVRYQSINRRQRFSSNTDQVIWTIGQ